MIENISVEQSHYPLQVQRRLHRRERGRKPHAHSGADGHQGARRQAQGGGRPGLEGNQRPDREDRPDALTRRSVQRSSITSASLLSEKATGEAGKKIRAGRRPRDKLVAEAQAAADRFPPCSMPTARRPSLVRQQLRHEMLQKIFSHDGVCPAGSFRPAAAILLLNKNPQEIRDAGDRPQQGQGGSQVGEVEGRRSNRNARDENREVRAGFVKTSVSFSQFSIAATLNSQFALRCSWHRTTHPSFRLSP